MCDFFSFVSNGNGKCFYFNHEQRKEYSSIQSDSHSTIAEHFKPNKYCKNNQRADDVVNKYEYNPFSKQFIVDQINITNDQIDAETWVKGLDFKEIVPNVNFDKKFTNPLDTVRGEVTYEEIDLLNQYVQLWGQLGDQLGGQLWGQLRGQLWGQLGDQLWGQLGGQLWDQLWGQLGGQLRGQLWDQLRGQLWDQLYSFGTTFVSDFKFKNETQEQLVSVINDLWSCGLVPFYDEVSREVYLFANSNAEIVYKEKI